MLSRLTSKKLLHKSPQSGQSLLETIVAIFILTSALTAGLGLSIYAFSSSETSVNEIVASNLAREGIEVVRAMRDTNWLMGDVNNTFGACNDSGLTSGTLCYSNWNSTPYNLAVGNSAANYRLDLNISNYPASQSSFGTSGDVWVLNNTSNYNLYLQSNGTYTNNACSGCSVAYARKIKLTKNTSSPFTTQNYEIIVQSIVAWNSKTCPSVAGVDPETVSSSCKVIVEEHLTNWKDYE